MATTGIWNGHNSSTSSNGLSATAPVFEFKPGQTTWNAGAPVFQPQGGFSLQAPEFVPSWMPCNTGCALNLDDYSECSSDSDAEPAPVVTKKCADDSRSDCSDHRSVSEPDAEFSADEGHSAAKQSDGGTTTTAEEPEIELSRTHEDQRLQNGCRFTIEQLLHWRCASEGLQDSSCILSSAEATELLPTQTCLKESKGKDSKDRGWQNISEARLAKPKLDTSENSWAGKQRQRKATSDADGTQDEDIARAMKSILNKLTIERFDVLYTQLISCGIRNVTHVELLTDEIFEKATTQHHFISMYADLCSMLHEHFNENPIVGKDQRGFKKILLSSCQSSFEKNLTAPKGLDLLNAEEKVFAEVKYKTRMFGNIRFVGALLVRKMLAGKVLLAICEELLSEPTPEALESLAVLLTAVGPTFDVPSWTYHVALTGIFGQVKALTQKRSLESRVRCLLKDVLDLRAAAWQDRKPKKLEGPTTLEAVAKKRAEEETSICHPRKGDHWEQVPRAHRTPQTRNPKTTFQKCLPRFDKDSFRNTVQAMLRELRVSHAVQDAIELMSENVPPAEAQPAELCNLLMCVAQEASAEARKHGFHLIVSLHAKKLWTADMNLGIHMFNVDVSPDLCFDVPTLPQILADELHPVLTPLVKAGLLATSKHAELLSGA